MQQKAKKIQSLTGIVVPLLWIALMALIYWFSDQPDTVSSEQSMRIGKLICSILVGGYDTLSEVTRNQYAELIDHFVIAGSDYVSMAQSGFFSSAARTAFSFRSPGDETALDCFPDR